MIKYEPKRYPLGQQKEWKRDSAARRRYSIWRTPGIYLVIGVIIAAFFYLKILGVIFVNGMNQK